MEDQEALALGATGAMVPLFVTGEDEGGGHRAAVVAEALGALARGLEDRGSRLLLARGRAEALVPALAARWRVEEVVAVRATDPRGRALEAEVERVLGLTGVPLRLLDGQTLIPPGSLRNGKGGPYGVFTPFARAFFRQAQPGSPCGIPAALPPLPEGLDLGTVEVAPGGPLGAAQGRLARFLAGPLATYGTDRDRPDRPGTSGLSADLACGVLSVRMVWAAVSDALGQGADPSARVFLTQLLWREFAQHLLWERPDLLRHPFRPAFQGFPWREDPAALAAWAAGRTGYPLVDAAARQLLATGFVHNRARMVAACFLAKDLLLSYRLGEAHYLRELADADPANNNLGWQWSAGCGCDAQPWFRVFNPVTQGERFDPDGEYVRRWLPELARMPARFIHRPWTAPAEVLARAGVALGATYPAPLVDHGAARQRFLAQAKAWLGRP